VKFGNLATGYVAVGPSGADPFFLLEESRAVLIDIVDRYPFTIEG
jgi:hypothetical protein